MKSKTFNLNELLVVLIMSSLAAFMAYNINCRVRGGGHQLRCESNLYALGRSMVMYQNEFKDKLPRPWHISSTDDPSSPDWQGFGGSGRPGGDFNRLDQYDLDYFCNPEWYEKVYPKDQDIQNVGLCLYILVRNEGTDPKSFLCPKSKTDQQMSLEAISVWAWTNRRWKIEFWRDLNNFQSMYNLSYSYHDPWNNYGIDEDAALMADKSNAFNTETGVKNPDVGDYPIQNPDGSWHNLDNKNPQYGNSPNHQTECQNVLYMNSSVKRGESPLMGVNLDNIYTHWSPKSAGELSKFIGRWEKCRSQGRTDSFLGN